MPSPCTVTGLLQTAADAALQGNAFVRFRLRNFSGFVPRVLGTSIIAEPQVDVLPAADGTFSATIWGNDNLDPSNTFYTVEWWNMGRITSQANYSITGSVFNLNSAGQLNPPPQPGTTGASQLVLETNGVKNANQQLLNLASSDGTVLLTDQGNGTVNLQTAAATGSLVLNSNTNIASGATFGSISLSVNLTTEGTYDWGIVTAAASAAQQIAYDPALWRWKQARVATLTPKGGLIFGGTSDVVAGGLTQGPISFSANAGDDLGGASSGATATYPLTGARSLAGLFQNTTLVVPTGYGFDQRIPLVAGQTRTINFYVFIRSQVNKTATGTFTAHLMDGSAADVTTTVVSTSGAGGATFFVNKITLTVKPATSCLLACSFILTSTTGVTGTTGDAIGIQAITMA